MGLLMSEGYVEVYIHSTPFNGTEPAWGAATAILCKIKGLRTTAEVTKKDAGGGCGLTKNRYGKGSATMTIDGLVQGGGFLFRTTGGVYPTSYPIWIRTKPNSNLVPADTFKGVITRWEWQMSDDEPQAENIEIDLTPDW